MRKDDDGAAGAVCAGLVLALWSVAGCHPGSFPVVPEVTASADTPALTAGIPCQAAAALKARCQSCHAAQPTLGAPMPLVTWDDLQQPAPSDPSKPTWKVA